VRKIGCAWCAKGRGRRRTAKYLVENAKTGRDADMAHSCGYHLGMAVTEIAGPGGKAVVTPLREE
jgi:hypothetical protein